MNFLALFLIAASLHSQHFEHVKMEEIKSNLISTVKYLSQDIGERSYLDIAKLNKTAEYIEKKFLSYGCDVKRQPFTYQGNTYYNIIAEVKGTNAADNKILVIGAHYDTVTGTPGADDNASGVAGLLELVRLTALNPFQKTVRFAAFCLEEPPVFRSRHMGSYVYAKSLDEEDADVYGMISLEMLGYYCNQKGCQYYPLPLFKWFYPDNGNFIAFVGNISSMSFTKRFKKSFEAVSSIPVESLNSISLVPGVDFSDHRNFWKFGYPAFMITDTAFYRNFNYHGPGDTASTLNYDKMAELVIGLYKAIKHLETER
jgi:Zn-dependent M28 family amino/carboxypeptidase